MALLSAEMILGDYCQSRVGYQPLAAKLLQQNLPPPCLGGVELPRRHKFPVGEMREPLFSSLDADELLDITPPRRQVLVAKRPIDANSLACICLEVEIAPAIDAAPPHDRATTDLTAANPVEGLAVRSRVRIVEVVDEKLACVFVAGAGVPLHRLISLELLAIAHSAIALLPRPHVLDVVDRWIDRASCFQYDCL